MDPIQQMPCRPGLLVKHMTSPVVIVLPVHRLYLKMSETALAAAITTSVRAHAALASAIYTLMKRRTSEAYRIAMRLRKACRAINVLALWKVHHNPS